MTVSVQFIYIFILFGAFLEMSGAGQWFIDLAYGATGTRKGGPAKASILASGFMGTISGSSHWRRPSSATSRRRSPGAGGSPSP